MNSVGETMHGVNSAHGGLSTLAGYLGQQGVQMICMFDWLADVQVWIKDREGRYVWVNRAFLLNLAINDESPSTDMDLVRGKTDYDLCPAYLADQYRTDDEHVLKGNCIVDRIELVGQHEEQTAWCVTNKIPLRGMEGHVVGTAGLTRKFKEQDAAATPGGNFSAVLNHLRQHYQKPTTNRQLAKLAGFSVRAFERRFLATFHMPPQRYLRKLRLRIAGRALVFTRQSIVEIALNCGFADQSHFTREFHRHFGKTPRDYREWYARTSAASITKTDGRTQ